MLTGLPLGRGVTLVFSWDFNTATLSFIGLQIVLLIVFLVRTNSKANDAYLMAEKAHKRADEAHVSVAALQGSVSMFREHVAAEYVDREALRLMEDRLTDAINGVGDRLDRALDRRLPK